VAESLVATRRVAAAGDPEWGASALSVTGGQISALDHAPHLLAAIIDGRGGGHELRVPDSHRPLTHHGASPTSSSGSAHARSGNEDEQGRVLAVEATTRYSAYRRFEVTTNETYTVPAKKPQ
jgi:hypothetical protein